VFDDAVGQSIDFVQDNHSQSRRGVLRGLHYQLPPHVQGKLVRVVRGRAFDVAVDIRRGSPTFGKWVGVTLDALRHWQLWIPPGFAHGFLALEDDTQSLYKTSDYYAKDCERVIAWNDPSIGIEWPVVGIYTLPTGTPPGPPFLWQTPSRPQRMNQRIAVQPVIMAGGSGTRLWPLSRAGYPKQFLVLTADNRSLFQQAVQRLHALAADDIALASPLTVGQ
jgi:dTDP-4-dehydrorhamnose 3,5-epimerase